MFRNRHLLPLLCLVAALALGLPQIGTASASVATTGNCTPAADWPAANAGFAAEVIALVNEHRDELGLGQLVASAPLTGAAVWKARHMAAYSYMTHNDPGPPIARGVGERLVACGYSTGGWGENIAYGYPAPEQVVAAWLASSGHRANIENPSFHAIGVGAAVTEGGVVYWAQDFGTSTGGGSPPFSPDPDPAPTAPEDPPSNDEPTGEPPSGGTTNGSEVVVQPTPVAPETPAAPPTDEVTSEPSQGDPGAPGIELTSLRVQAGKARTSNPSSLEADDLRSLVVHSRAGRTAWRALFGLSDAALDADDLQLTFRSASTLPCRQTISVWSPTRKAWLALDRRLLGSRETQIQDVIDGAEVDARGNVLVRVLCQRNDERPFSTRADLLTIES